MIFTVLSSGSKQNCFHVESGETGILIDAGFSANKLTLLLHQCGKDAAKIQGIFVTHEHLDHVRGLRSFIRNLKIPAYIHDCSKEALDYRLKTSVSIQPYETLSLGSLKITPFPVSHDAKNTFGYHIRGSGGKSLFFERCSVYSATVSAGRHPKVSGPGSTMAPIGGRYGVTTLSVGPGPDRPTLEALVRESSTESSGSKG